MWNGVQYCRTGNARAYKINAEGAIMTVTSRQQQILELLQADPNINVATLSVRLNVSEPTIRRDLCELDRRGLVTRVYGGAKLRPAAPDSVIPFLIRENEKSTSKVEMGKRAAEYVRDGMVIMLDGSTSAYYIVPYLKKFKDLIVITSGAKTAVALAEANIRTLSCGGEMIIHSFSYVGEQAESFVKKINADLLFFSCRGLSNDGKMTDVSVEEANLRRIMMEQSEKKILLCDKSKIGKTYFYNMGTVKEVDAVISDTDICFE